MVSLEEFPNGVKIFQTQEYKFTKDSIELAKFCNVKHSDHLLELCAGSGAVSFYIYAVTKFEKLYLNELQQLFIETLNKNISLNNIKAQILQGDLKNINLDMLDKKVDVIVCNPPYFKGRASKNLEYSKAIARHEITITLKDIIKKASELIKDKGKFYLSMTADRSAELITELCANNFQPKKIKYLTSGKSEAYLILIEAVYKGKTGVKIIIE